MTARDEIANLFPYVVHLHVRYNANSMARLSRRSSVAQDNMSGTESLGTPKGRPRISESEKAGG
jgi:hypothetical protein